MAYGRYLCVPAEDSLVFLAHKRDDGWYDFVTTSFDEVRQQSAEKARRKKAENR